MSAETRDAWVEEKDAESNRKSGSVLSVPCFKIELILIILYFKTFLFKKRFANNYRRYGMGKPDKGLDLGYDATLSF